MYSMYGPGRLLQMQKTDRRWLILMHAADGDCLDSNWICMKCTDRAQTSVTSLFVCDTMELFDYAAAVARAHVCACVCVWSIIFKWGSIVSNEVIDQIGRVTNYNSIYQVHHWRSIFHMDICVAESQDANRIPSTNIDSPTQLPWTLFKIDSSTHISMALSNHTYRTIAKTM